MTRPSRSGRFQWPDSFDEVNHQWTEIARTAPCRDCGAIVWPESEEAHDAWHDKLTEEEKDA